MDKLETLLAALAAAGHTVYRGVSDYNGMACTVVSIRKDGAITSEMTFFDDDFKEILEIAGDLPSPYKTHLDYSHQD